AFSDPNDLCTKNPGHWFFSARGGNNPQAERNVRLTKVATLESTFSQDHDTLYDMRCSYVPPLEDGYNEDYASTPLDGFLVGRPKTVDGVAVLELGCQS
ncbi:unnamed protein product, partial [Amoebophrya sp. A25]